MSLFSEVGRRNVARVGIAYLATVWVLIQVADVVIPNVGAPDWVIQVLLAASAVGFPVALVLAWFYEWTSEGIKAADDLPAVGPVAFTGRKIDYAIIGLLVFAVGFLVVDNYLLDVPDGRDQWIAVLPFTNLSAVEEESAEFFSIGMHDALLTQLFKLSAMKVSSRTSVLEYANSPKNMRQIGEELGVATILEGSVLRAGDAFHISVQLIDALTDEHLWAEDYNRALSVESIFTLQKEIAISIADALQATLSPQEIERLSDVPTQNLQAYDYYSSARRYEGSPGDHDLRVRQYKAAVEADPGFALAWAGLADAYINLSFNMHDGQADAAGLRDLAREAAEMALSLAPDLAEAHVAMASSHSAEDNFEAALASFAEAAKRAPRNATIYRQRAFLRANQGQFEAAAADFERSLVLDPNGRGPHVQGAHVYMFLHNYERAGQLLDRQLERQPDDGGAHPRKFLLQAAKGDLQGMKAAVESMILLRGGAQYQRRWTTAFYEGDLNGALRILKEWDANQGYTGDDSIAWAYGKTYKFLSPTPELAEPYFQQFLIEQEQEPPPDDTSMGAAVLAEVYGYLGEPQQALPLIRQAVLSIPAHIGIRTMAEELHLTVIWALIAAGDYPGALAQLEAYLEGPMVMSIEGLQLDPRLGPLLNEPGFQALWERYRRRPD